jgi:hypothetical protein
VPGGFEDVCPPSRDGGFRRCANDDGFRADCGKAVDLRADVQLDHVIFG